MSERRPEPGSPWARHCPDAWPREWLADSGGRLPDGFTRAADPLEADLITGRASEAAFLTATGRQTPGGSSLSAPPKRRRNPVVVKVLGYRRFFEGLSALNPPLSPGAAAVWCWLWTCEGKGHARCSVRRIARRFGVGRSTAGRWLLELTAARLVLVVRRGKTGRTPTVVRVTPTPHNCTL